MAEELNVKFYLIKKYINTVPDTELYRIKSPVEGSTSPHMLKMSLYSNAKVP